MTTLKSLRSGIVALVLPLLIGLFSEFAQAQATIGVSGSSATLTKIGYTELVGSVTFTVATGTTVAGNLEFFVPNTVLTETGGISLSGTGGLTGATIAAVVPSNGIVEISVPAGAVAGSSATLNGVRVSAVGSTLTTLNASISSTGNSIVAGQNSVTIMTGVADGLTVDVSAGNTVSTSSGVVIMGPGTIVVGEGWNHAFSGSVGTSGQTAKTQLIFQVIGLPDNVSLTFPALIFSDSGDGANIQTLSGGAETLTNQSTTNQVVYQFSDSVSSSIMIDTFSIIPTLAINGQPGNGTAYIQVALGPIGAAVPNDQYPSTAVPRFAANFLPPATQAQQAITTTSVPVPRGITNDSFSLSNIGSGGAIVTAQAKREDGTINTDVPGPATVNLASHQTSLISLTSLFGTVASPSNIAAVEFSTANTGLVANSLGTIQGSRVGFATPAQQLLTYLPFDRQTSTDVPILNVQNAGDSDVPAQFNLYSSTGGAIATVSATVKAHGALRQDLAGLFAPSVPLDGYVAVQGTAGPLRAILLNRPSTAPEDVPSLVQSSNSPLNFPFFAIGGGYNTVLNLINTSSNTVVKVSISPFTAAGVPVVPQPFVQSLAPGQRQSFDFNSIFGLNSLISGYFSLSLSSTVLTPFSSFPTVVGVVRISTGGARADVPLVSNAGTQFYMTPAVESTDSYTGLSIFNVTGNPASVTVDAFSASGTALGSATVNVSSGSAKIQLLRELIPQAVGNDNVLLRISASANVTVLGFRGTFSGSELIYLRGETNP